MATIANFLCGRGIPHRARHGGARRAITAALLLLALLLAAPLAAREALAPTLLRDPGHALAAEDAWQAQAQGAFAPLPDAAASLGFTRDALWFHLRVEPDRAEPAREVLVIEQPRLDRIDVFVRHDDGRRAQAALGDTRPFAARSFDHRWPNLALDLRGAGAQVLLRVQSDSSVQLPLARLTPTALYRQTHAEQLGIGLYYGILLALLLYNLAVLISIRDASYLYYVLYVLAFGLMMLSFNGTGFQYLWPQAPRFQDLALPLGLGGLLAATIAFARSFLDLRRQLPRVARAIDAVIVLALALMVVAVAGFEYQALIALNVAVMAMGVVVTGSALVCAARGSRPARYFLLAWSLLIAGGVALPLSSFGVLPRTFLTEYSIQFGSAAEMLLLSFSLAHRINLLKGENERLMRATTEDLEHRVQARTTELNAALQRLEHANRQLHDISHRDGLTGVANRRHFDQALDYAWSRCAALGQPISLLLIDIDRFKTINDSHGHLAGDDALRAVAQRLRAGEQAPDETLARYGGEEFVLLLPAVGAAAAQARAEQLRAAVAAAPVRHEGGELVVTVSIGLATLAPGREGALADLLRLSDAALYRAKREGRDRVVVAA